MEPATTERLFRGGRVFQVPLHHGVTTQEDLTDGFAVLGDWLHGVGISHHGAAQRVVTHTLAGFDLGAIMQRQLVPLGFPGTHSDRSIDFGQAIHVRNLDAHFFDGANHLGRGRSAGSHGLHFVVDARLGFR